MNKALRVASSHQNAVRSIILTAISLVYCCGCNEVQEHHFENLDAAKQEQMVEKGWIPAFMPVDATNIDVDEDLDTARVYGSYISSNTASLRKHCSSAAGSFRVPGYGPKWFQEDVKEAGDTADKLRSKGYEVFHCDEQNLNVIFVRSRNYVSYWSVRR